MTGLELAAVKSTAFAVEAVEGVGVSAEVAGVAERAYGVAAVADVEGWSVEALNQVADEVTGINGPETVALLDSKGEVAVYVSEAEASIYETAGLQPKEVAGRETLVRTDIDWARTDAYGETNLERAERGRAPLDENNEPYQLHHVQQKNDGVLAELTATEHQSEVNDRVLHDDVGPGEIDRKAFAGHRADHWRARAAEIRAGMT